MFHVNLKKASRRAENIYFRIIPNAAGGNCLFLTIWDFLAKNEANLSRKVPEKSEVRRDIVKYVACDFVWNELEHVIIENLKTKLASLKSVLENDGTINKKLFQQSKHEYVQYMNSDGICGTFVELIAATKVFGFVGVILKENVDRGGFDCYEFGTSDDSGADKRKPLLFMLFKGATEDGHFEVLDPINQKQSRIVLSKPSTPSADDGKEEGDDYAGDDDYQYDDEDENKSGQTIKDDNSVHTPPYFETTEYKKIAKVGDNVLLECGAKNLAGSNVILWYNKTTLLTQSKFRISNDARVSVDEDLYNLRINNIQESDASQYYCTVIPNNISMQVNLEIGSNPTAAIYDKEGREISNRQMTYHQGDRIEIECRGFGIPHPQIKWFAKGERVVGGSNNIHVNNGFLIIDHADHQHVKLYQCLADNGVSVGHATFNINVQYSPKVNAHRHIVNTMDGDDADLHCNYKSTTLSKVVWHKDKKVLALNNLDKYSTSNETKDEHHESNVLVIKNVEKNDLGEYECVVQNSIGKGHVQIHLGYEPEPPKFERVELEGDTVTTHWVIRSLQPLNEVMLNYQKSGNKNWLSEKPVHSEKSKEHSGIWRIQHKLTLDAGTWNARVKAKNAVGWSQYSDQEKLVVTPNLYDDDFEREYPEANIQKAGIAGSSGASAVIYQLSSAVCLASLLLATLRI